MPGKVQQIVERRHEGAPAWTLFSRGRESQRAEKGEKKERAGERCRVDSERHKHLVDRARLQSISSFISNSQFPKHNSDTITSREDRTRRGVERRNDESNSFSCATVRDLRGRGTTRRRLLLPRRHSSTISRRGRSQGRGDIVVKEFEMKVKRDEKRSLKGRG